jgi:hypothetical protein
MYLVVIASGLSLTNTATWNVIVLNLRRIHWHITRCMCSLAVYRNGNRYSTGEAYMEISRLCNESIVYILQLACMILCPLQEECLYESLAFVLILSVTINRLLLVKISLLLESIHHFRDIFLSDRGICLG